jgi:hexosaminidase
MRSFFQKLNSAFALSFGVILFLTTCTGSAQQTPSIALIPEPATLQKMQGAFELSASTTIGVTANNADAAKVATYLATAIRPATGFTLKTGATGTIQMDVLTKPNTRLGKEGYTLDVADKKVSIRANTAAGLFYGVQSLLQLLPREIESAKAATGVSWKIPSVAVLDYPRFAWRGMMLDVSRHFFTKEYVKTYIDRMARYKFNRLHWHLTDDNGWRIEIKSLPRLTQVGANRVQRYGTWGRHEAPKPGEKATDGGFYTQEDIREIIQYAKDRFVEILPEIDVPGHSMAAIAAYPELCVTKDTTVKVNPGSNFSKWFGNGKFEMYVDNTLNPTSEYTYQFLDKVFTEVAALFPFEYIHMGGDECYKGYWERDPGVQAFMKQNKLSNGEELQNYFVQRISKIVISKKKKMMGWDEILEGGEAPAGAAVMSWRGIKGGIEASRDKHTVVMSPAPDYYLDMMQGDAAVEVPVYGSSRLKNVYDFNLLPAGIDSAFVIGGQGNLWTEQVITPAQVEYMTYPRAFAISETLWSPKPKKNWNNFVGKVESHFGRFDQAGANYASSLYDAVIAVKKADGKLAVELTTEAPGLDIYYTLDNTIPNVYAQKYTGPVALPEGTDNLRVITYRHGKPTGHLISLKKEDIEKRLKK